MIRTCLKEVDKCRPYFIGLIGSGCGWVPELNDILMDPDLLTKYPWIEEVATDGAGVTEMEFIHDVFNAPAVDGEYAFFYRRSDDPFGADEPERLKSSIDRARASGSPFHEFDTVDALGNTVRSDPVTMMERYRPRPHPNWIGRYRFGRHRISVAIAEELSIPDSAFRGSVLPTTIDAAEGAIDRARQHLRGMPELFVDDERTPHSTVNFGSID